MSPALPVRKVARVIQSLGFAYVRTKGSHAVYRHPNRPAVVRQPGCGRNFPNAST